MHRHWYRDNGILVRKKIVKSSVQPVFCEKKKSQKTRPHNSWNLNQDLKTFSQENEHDQTISKQNPSVERDQAVVLS